MKVYIFLFVTLFTILSCKQEEKENPLKGYWVRLDSPTDTLTFEVEFSNRYFVLRRGYEIRNGYLLPLMGSGPYEFKTLKDSIDILPGYSSSHYYRRYYFKVNGNKMELGNFIDDTKLPSFFGNCRWETSLFTATSCSKKNADVSIVNSPFTIAFIPKCKILG